MSLLPTERLAVGITPAQVGVAHVRAGWRHNESRQALIDVAPPETSTPVWQAALDGLDAWLAGQTLRRAATTLVLSNRFVRFALAPWTEATGAPEEEAALARACLESRYGDMADWTVRLDVGRYGEPRIVCAVETALLDAARQVVARHRLKCRAVCPAFVLGWNRFRRELDGSTGRGDAMFAMTESDILVMATRRAGLWYSLRSVATLAGAPALPILIEREALLQDFAEPLPTWLSMPGLLGRDIDAAVGPRLRIIGEESTTATALTLAGWTGKP